MKTLVIFFLFSKLLLAASSSNYTLIHGADSTGSGNAFSTNYEIANSSESGLLANSSLYSLVPQFLARAATGSFLRLILTPEEMPELSIGQLTIESVDEDGIITQIAPETVSFEILEGPVATISSTGEITAGATYQNQSARISARSANASGDLFFQIIETQEDNFGTYGNDSLPDDWQAQFFGPNSPNASFLDDFDHDGLANLVEYFFEQNPADGKGFASHFNGTFIAGDDISIGGISGSELYYVFDVLIPNNLKGYTYEIQTSFDLSFTDLPSPTPIRSAPWGPDFARHTLAIPVPTDTTAHAFVRVAISTPDPE